MKSKESEDICACCDAGKILLNFSFVASYRNFVIEYLVAKQ